MNHSRAWAALAVVMALTVVAGCDSASDETHETPAATGDAKRKKTPRREEPTKGGTRAKVDAAVALFADYKVDEGKAAIKSLGDEAIPSLKAAFGDALAEHRKLAKARAAAKGGDKGKAARAAAKASYTWNAVLKATVAVGPKGCEALKVWRKEAASTCAKAYPAGGKECAVETLEMSRHMAACKRR